jgi:peroxiredoxin family protein
VKKLAVIVTRGGYNNLLQACEWITLAASKGVQVGVLFRDEAAAKMSLNKSKELTFSEGYRGREVHIRNILREQKKSDLQELLRFAKEAGDVKFSVCRDSLGYFGIPVEDLIPELDEVQRAEAFWQEEVTEADQVLTF